MSGPTLPADTPTLGASETLCEPGLDRAPPDRAESREPGPGDVIGRYVVLHRLGRGGMGVVLAAFDPQLDRKIALKLLHSEPGREHRASRKRDRLLREARVMAQLSHPNIVTVHDVGEHERRVFLAMEFVEGRTLAQWQEQGPRSWQETLVVYLAAGRGLAAAHAQGLVHRDFKPDNVMIDEHQRVRVMDFGLALRREEESTRDPVIPAELSHPVSATLTEAGRLMGTPAYMSPEQWSQREADARSDQFSFCVSLFEALHGQRPFAGSSMPEIAASVLAGQLRTAPDSSRAPAWLLRALRRGLAIDPADRFESMDRCLEALARGQARRRLRLIALGGAGLVLAGLGALAASRLAERRRIEACHAQGAEIEASWNPGTAAGLRRAFVDTGVSFAEPSADTVVAHFDHFADTWRSTKTAVCLGAEDHEASQGERVERAQWCLEEHRAQLDVLVRELGEADRITIEHAVTTAMSLANVEPCGDPIALQRLVAPERVHRDSALAVHRDIARGLALGRAGLDEDGLAVAVEARRRAQELQWPPLVAAASLAVGTIQSMQERYSEAEVSFEAAFFAARAAEATSIEAEAAIQLVGLVGGELGRHGDGMRWSRHGALALDGLGESAVLSRATMLSLRGMVERRGGAYGAATADLGRALAIREARLGQAHPMVATVLANLGLVAWDAGRYDEADALHRRSLEINEASLGAGHPSVARALNNLAILHETSGHYEQAEALHRRAREIFEAAYGPEHTDVAMSINNLGVVAIARGRVDEARALHARAIEIWERVLGPDHPEVAQGLANLAAAVEQLGDGDEARRLYLRALELQRRKLGPDHPTVGDTLNNLGVNHFEAGAYADAITYYEQALHIFERALGTDHPRVATALDNLAEAALFSGAPDRAEPLYRRALGIHERTLEPDHPDLSYTLVGLAQLELARGAPGRALPLITRAVRLRHATSPDDVYAAEARFIRARALLDAPHDDGGDREDALREAEAAETIYRGLEGYEEQAAAIARWRREHGGSR
ncbi:serine/threonine-protein kinase [Paraliomyxa miuraensis]|uniref:serine/threonine-protein kinase n=1 Tax=Paraliomyxa miuraensis TaxID=376150 RepID=UPI002259801B|nr:serine/threonine-protein kinase [Paraliomyxa miuraensis]MCX4241979.1 serine/threonine-protein kinase [Paraliomyxa miuraensis]